MFGLDRHNLAHATEWGAAMPPAAICDACGARSTAGGRIRRLSELGFGPENEGRAIHLCEECLDQREERTWQIDEDDGQRIYEALHERHQVSGKRYSYLMQGAERIHLVRLQPEWVDQQAADV